MCARQMCEFLMSIRRLELWKIKIICFASEGYEIHFGFVDTHAHIISSNIIVVIQFISMAIT